MSYKIQKLPEGSDEEEPYTASHAASDEEPDEASHEASYMPRVTFNEFKESSSQSEPPVELTKKFVNRFASNTLSPVRYNVYDKNGNLVDSVIGWDPDPIEESAAKTRQEIAELEKQYYPEMSTSELKQVEEVEKNTELNKEHAIDRKDIINTLRKKKKEGFHLIDVERIEDSNGVHYHFKWSSIFIPEEQRAETPQLIGVKRFSNSHPKRQIKTQITSESPDFYKKFFEYLGIFDRVQSAEKILIGYSNFPNDPRGGTKKRNKKFSTKKRNKKYSTKKRNKKYNTKKRKSIKRK
jgi:hypothetical protein